MNVLINLLSELHNLFFDDLECDTVEGEDFYFKIVSNGKVEFCRKGVVTNFV